MSNIVNPAIIEGIVGVSRHETDHYGRVVTADATLYILHSQQCLDKNLDLRDCEYSVALDYGINLDKWPMDTPVVVDINVDELVSA